MIWDNLLTFFISFLSKKKKKQNHQLMSSVNKVVQWVWECKVRMEDFKVENEYKICLYIGIFIKV